MTQAVTVPEFERWGRIRLSNSRARKPLLRHSAHGRLVFGKHRLQLHNLSNIFWCLFLLCYVCISFVINFVFWNVLCTETSAMNIVVRYIESKVGIRLWFKCGTLVPFASESALAKVKRMVLSGASCSGLP